MQNVRMYAVSCIEQAAGDVISPECRRLRWAATRTVFWTVVLGVIGRPI